MPPNSEAPRTACRMKGRMRPWQPRSLFGGTTDRSFGAKMSKPPCARGNLRTRKVCPFPLSKRGAAFRKRGCGTPPARTTKSMCEPNRISKSL
ncbi:hypothetical protein CSUI_008830 [Cystoisospora suis]|uniref:Uncharacterized protein n=1 Tax=Cystoisospora suis TaxID=483139 RepID=A0A2C6KL35_9APIC|nr:hypothetical protein CSUI_008830 [Cystoisospora suis]